jgi:hypothetical protein
MKFNDVVTEAPMNFLKRFANKAVSKVPGGIGHKAQGKLDTGNVANSWKNKYMKYLGQSNQKATTDSLKNFLKNLGFDDGIISNTVTESVLTERSLTRTEVDKIFLSLAQKSAANTNDTPGGNQPPTNTPPAAAAAGAPSLPPRRLNTKAHGIPKISRGQGSPIEKYIHNWAGSINAAASEQEKINLAKEVVNFLADRQGQPESERAKAQVAATLRRSGLNPSVNSKVLRAVKNGVRLERRNYQLANMVLEAVGLSWKAIGYRIALSESTLTHVVLTLIEEHHVSKSSKPTLNEDIIFVLNNLRWLTESARKAEISRRLNEGFATLAKEILGENADVYSELSNKSPQSVSNFIKSNLKSIPGQVRSQITSSLNSIMKKAPDVFKATLPIVAAGMMLSMAGGDAQADDNRGANALRVIPSIASNMLDIAKRLDAIEASRSQTGTSASQPAARTSASQPAARTSASQPATGRYNIPRVDSGEAAFNADLGKARDAIAAAQANVGRNRETANRIQQMLNTLNKK